MAQSIQDPQTLEDMELLGAQIAAQSIEPRERITQAEGDRRNRTRWEAQRITYGIIADSFGRYWETDYMPTNYRLIKMEREPTIKTMYYEGKGKFNNLKNTTPKIDTVIIIFSFTQIIKQLLNAGIKPFILEITPREDVRDERECTVEEFEARRIKLNYQLEKTLPLFTGYNTLIRVTGPDGNPHKMEYTCRDRIHPSKTDYYIMAESISRHINHELSTPRLIQRPLIKTTESMDRANFTTTRWDKETQTDESFIRAWWLDNADIIRQRYVQGVFHMEEPEEPAQPE